VVTSPVRIGSYRIERLLGIGSFATVWLGYDASLGAHVAIKVLAENWSHDLRVRERFLDEGRMLWQIDHDRVVRVHALGELPDGRPYLVMAWADGGSLRDRLALAPIPPVPALRVLREICRGVAVLHDNGIVHRDLTPGNVLFRSRRGTNGTAPAADQVVIADLGLAKALAAASGLTARAGTPGYMAPEQDDPLAVVDERTDVFGLGRLGLRLLGDPDGGGSEQNVRLREGVPPPVAGVLRTATARQPADRYRDATAFAAALDRATSGRPGRRARTAAGVAATATAIVGLLAADSVNGRFTSEPGMAVDPAGRIAVAVPAGWRVQSGSWAGPAEDGRQRGPVLVISPDPGRWIADAAVPGAFIWLFRDGATPAEFVAGRPHAGCTAAPVRSSRQAGIDWLIAGYTGCPGGRSTVVEAAATGPGGAGLVYVQVAPPAGSGPTFVDSLLAGVRVR
jgi:hypothetical protein